VSKLGGKSNIALDERGGIILEEIRFGKKKIWE